MGHATYTDWFQKRTVTRSRDTPLPKTLPDLDEFYYSSRYPTFLPRAQSSCNPSFVLRACVL